MTSGENGTAKPKPHGVALAAVQDEFTFDETKEYQVAADANAEAKKEDAPTETTTDEKRAEEEEAKLASLKIRHQVAVPVGYDYVPLKAGQPIADPARTYPFTLDPFQATSIQCIERNESVLVAAHTSAGKTVIAEYAIAKALRNKQRVIYTSPIKALSNQKYRDLLKEFGDVGLMTGDVTINPSASALVMTTEILRSMMYRGSEVMREVSWVVFDEIHYMRDKARGVVWEETIILLPDKVRYVFLSATIPNAQQFAQWITCIHAQPCHVVYTDYRPTPLQHYLFPSGGNGIHLCVDEKGTFREENFQRAISSLGDADDHAPAEKKLKGKKKPTSGASDLYKLIKMILARKYHPVIIFSFAKRECEAYAAQISKIDFNDDKEKEMVETVFESAVSTLSKEDRELPQITHLLPLLKRGIGIHHSGLLPLLKEIIEILFQENLIKVLFATETFSIGLNMPAKTVVFTSVRKFDGKEQRWVSGGEYVQMSGRAGRRGLDDRGIVIMMLDEKMPPNVAQGMLKGEADVLNSAFHLRYNMILNLIRVEGMPPESILQKSFHQFQNSQHVPQLEEKMKTIQASADALTFGDAKMAQEEREELEEELDDMYETERQLKSYQRDLRAVMFHPDYVGPFLNAGRLVQVKSTEEEDPRYDYGWSFVVNAMPAKKPGSVVKRDRDGNVIPSQNEKNEADYLIDVAVRCLPGDWRKGASTFPIAYTSGDAKTKPAMPEIHIITVRTANVYGISSVRVNMPQELKSSASKTLAAKSIAEVIRRFPDGLPPLDPVTHMRINDPEFASIKQKAATLTTKLDNALKAGTKEGQPAEQAIAERKAMMSQYAVKAGMLEEIKALKKMVKSTNAVLMMEDLKSKRRVLRRMGYTDATDIITMKGRVACEISTGDELMLTELMFNGVFADLDPLQCGALLSCFVFDEKTSDEKKSVREELQAPLRVLQETARQIVKVSNESKQTLDEEEYVNSFRPELMEITYEWMKGAPFSQIMKMTSIFEGSIVRCMRRLDELLKQMSQAAKAIGNTELENKFAEAIAKLKRGIVFAASLYLQ